MKKPKTTKALEITESDNGYAVYDPNKEKVHFLNDMGILILEMCNGENSTDIIINLITQSFQLSEDHSSEINKYIDQLHNEGLIDYADTN